VCPREFGEHIGEEEKRKRKGTEQRTLMKRGERAKRPKRPTITEEKSH